MTNLHHPYLYDKVCTDRLYDEWLKHKSLVIAYDFDSTVYDFHAKGHDYKEIIEILRECNELGFYLIVFTAEQNKEKISKFLDENAIPYNAINENPPFWKGTTGKIYYNHLLDDRAGLRSAYKILVAVVQLIRNPKGKEKEQENEKPIRWDIRSELPSK